MALNRSLALARRTHNTRLHQRKQCDTEAFHYTAPSADIWANADAQCAGAGASRLCAGETSLGAPARRARANLDKVQRGGVGSESTSEDEINVS